MGVTGIDWIRLVNNCIQVTIPKNSTKINGNKIETEDMMSEKTFINKLNYSHNSQATTVLAA